MHRAVLAAALMVSAACSSSASAPTAPASPTPATGGRSGTAGTISTVAGTGGGAYSGDGGPATGAELNLPIDVAVGPNGELFVADSANHVVRVVDEAGSITTIAGVGEPGYAGDGGPATEAGLSRPGGLTLGADGALYVADRDNGVIRRIGPEGTIETVAGSGRSRYPGDGGPATEAGLDPANVALDAQGNLYIADEVNHSVRIVDPEGIISTLAGTGEPGYAGDGGPATEAQLDSPLGVAVAPDGTVYIAEYGNHVVRRVGPDGTISTVAGTGVDGTPSFEGPATEQDLRTPTDVTIDEQGRVIFSDHELMWVFVIESDGRLVPIAGTGASVGALGDGGPATDAALHFPWGIAFDEDVGLLIADLYHHRVRLVA